MRRIDLLRTVPVIGETYLVPCVNVFGYRVPIHHNLHDDVENGQHYRHYHVDSRFEGNTGVGMWDGRVDERTAVKFGIRYEPLEYKTHEDRLITNNELIGKIKLKGLRCFGNRCPHRGYNLATVPWENGVRTCPLHGTQINRKGIVV